MPESRSSRQLDTRERKRQRILRAAIEVFASKGYFTARMTDIARAAEVFLQRRLFRRRRDGQILAPDFIRLHYPCYWHYDILGGLHALGDAGFVDLSTFDEGTYLYDVLLRGDTRGDARVLSGDVVFIPPVAGG